MGPSEIRVWWTCSRFRIQGNEICAIPILRKVTMSTIKELQNLWNRIACDAIYYNSVRSIWQSTEIFVQATVVCQGMVFVLESIYTKRKGKRTRKQKFSFVFSASISKSMHDGLPFDIDIGFVFTFRSCVRRQSQH